MINNYQKYILKNFLICFFKITFVFSTVVIVMNLLEELNTEENSQTNSNTNQTNFINNSTNIQEQEPLLNINQRTIRPPNSNNTFQSNSSLFSRLLNTHTDTINPQNDLSGNIYSLQFFVSHKIFK